MLSGRRENGARALRLRRKWSAPALRLRRKWSARAPLAAQVERACPPLAAEMERVRSACSENGASMISGCYAKWSWLCKFHQSLGVECFRAFA